MSTKPRGRRAPSTGSEGGDPTAPRKGAKPARAGKQPARAAGPPAKQKQPVKGANPSPKPALPAAAPEDPEVPVAGVATGLGLRPERAWAARMASAGPALAAQPPRPPPTTPEPVRVLVVSPDAEPVIPSAPDLPPGRAVADRPDPPPDGQRHPVVPPERPVLPRGVLTRGTGLVAGLLVVFLLLGQGVDGPGVEPSASAAQETPALDVDGATTLRETFDELAMDSGLPDRWTVTGLWSAAIVALPTSVDRSVRLASDETGLPATACLSIDGVRAPEVTIVVDYHVGRSPPSPVPLLSLEANDTQSLTLLVDSMGMPVGITSPGGSNGVIDTPTNAPTRAIGVASPAWRRVELTVARVSGEVSWSVRDSSGRATHSGEGTLAAGLVVAPLEALCLHSPEGEPSGWVAIDDINVE